MADIPVTYTAVAAPPISAVKITPDIISDAYLVRGNPFYTIDWKVSTDGGDPYTIIGYRLETIDPVTGVTTLTEVDDVDGSNGGLLQSFGGDVYFVDNAFDGLQKTDWLFATAPLGDPLVETIVTLPELDEGLVYANNNNFPYQLIDGRILSVGILEKPDTTAELFAALFELDGTGQLYTVATFPDFATASQYNSTFNTMLQENVGGYDFALFTFDDEYKLLLFNAVAYGGAADFVTYAVSFDPPLDPDYTSIVGANGPSMFLAVYDDDGRDFLIDLDLVTGTYKSFDLGIEQISVGAARNLTSSYFILGYDYITFDAYAYTAPLVIPAGTVKVNSLSVKDAVGLPCYSPCRPLIIAERIKSK